MIHQWPKKPSRFYLQYIQYTTLHSIPPYYEVCDGPAQLFSGQVEGDPSGEGSEWQGCLLCMAGGGGGAEEEGGCY